MTEPAFIGTVRIVGCTRPRHWIRIGSIALVTEVRGDGTDRVELFGHCRDSDHRIRQSVSLADVEWIDKPPGM